MTKKFDLIIIGGGISGAALAWEASHRGLQTLLLEENDFAGGTSANSMKTIHGGIRYLQNLDLMRTMYSARERKYLLHIAPHLVMPLKCQLPTPFSLTKNPLAIAIALSIYNLLTLNRNSPPTGSHRIAPARLLSKEKFLKNMHLNLGRFWGGFEWTDGQAVNTERLVLAFLKSAQTAGAEARNYTAVRKVSQSPQDSYHVEAFDYRIDERISFQADIVADCSNGFTRTPLWENDPDLGYVKAVNLVVDRQITDSGFGVKALTGQIGRFLFLVPWRGKSIAGTWYLSQGFDGPKKSISKEHFRQCLEELNSVLIDHKITEEEVLDIHVGFLPASRKRLNKYGADKSLLEKPLISLSGNSSNKGLVRVVGTKYTMARYVAEKTVNLIGRRCKKTLISSRSKVQPLTGGELDNPESFKKQLIKRYSTILDSAKIVYLADFYGSEVEQVITFAKSYQDSYEQVPGATVWLKVQVYYAVEKEAAWTISDILCRRIDLGTCQVPAAETVQFCADFLAGHFALSDSQKHAAVREFNQSYRAWSKHTG